MDHKDKYMEALKRRRKTDEMAFLGGEEEGIEIGDKPGEQDDKGFPVDGTAPEIKDSEKEMVDGEMGIGELLEGVGPLAKLAQLLAPLLKKGELSDG